ncbi:MAG: hypothetical protein HYZ83_05750 [Candidatus Omnitrophica bacterium]|nr:hypothetical protein [Candidatus Omnitrophota bacterium]
MSRIKYFFLVIFLLNGCASLVFKQAPVQFEDPVIRLSIVDRTPTPEEASGITLRLIPPPDGVEQALEKTQMFAQIKNNQGLKVEMTRKQKNHYESIGGTPHYLLKSETVIEEGGGAMLEETEISDRGEIIKFIRGHHKSKIGTFRIEKWNRTSVLPEGPVKIGDTWNYEEILSLKLESLLVKQKNPLPYVLRATSTLEGFAAVKGKPVAVIKTRASQTKQEEMKILFKTIKMTIQATIDETNYFDWKNGKVIAKVTRINSFSYTPDAKFTDTGQSQSIYEMIDETKTPPSG